MAHREAVVDQETAQDDRPVVVADLRRWSKAAKIAGVLLAGAALFAAGVLVANQFGGQDGVADEAADVRVLQQMGQLTQQADAIIADVKAADANDLIKQQAFGVQLQTIAVALAALPPQAQDEQLRQVSQLVADGYLDLSIGLVTNNAAKTTDGAQKLTDSRDALVEYLGTAVDQPGGDAPADPSGTGD